MSKRTKAVFTGGLVIFVAGLLLLARGAGGESSDGGAKGGSALYAARPIPEGTTGASAVNDGLVQTKRVSSSARPAGALTDFSQLAGTVTAAAVPQGKVLVAEDFPPASTRLGNLKIPDGKTALALQMANVPGLAGFAGVGDKIDIYGVAKQAGGSGAGEVGGPGVRLILQHVEVLSINGGAVAPVQGKPEGPALVYLLAVTPAEAEQLIFLTSFEQLYFSLVPRDQRPVPPTPGANPAGSLGVT